MKKIYTVIFGVLAMATLLLTNSCSKKKDVTPQTQNNPKPVVDFDFTTIGNGLLPVKVTFKNKTKNADTYKWYFGDSKTSDATDPEHIFEEEKVYNVKLVASGKYGKDSVTKSVTITSDKPKADFNFRIVNENEVPLKITFTSNSVKGDSYLWKFDDGTTSDKETTDKTFRLSKTYQVKLIVTNAAGKDSITKPVAVVINKPKADFSINASNNGTMPVTATFNSSSLRAETYKWYFGDGNTAAQPAPTNVYTLSKTFNVKLVVTNSAGSDSITKPVVINKLNLSVRVLLITPTDRKFNQKYYDVLKKTALNIQKWYKDHNGGKTFTLNNPVVDTLKGLHDYTWYNAYNGTYSGTDPRFYAVNNTNYEISLILKNDFNTSKYIYAIYVAAPGGGAGGGGYCALGDQDLDGLLGKNPENTNINRWIGGSAHEWGHAFGLPHPPGQEWQALMWTGYTIYPDCILQQADKDILAGSPFFK